MRVVSVQETPGHNSQADVGAMRPTQLLGVLWVRIKAVQIPSCSGAMCHGWEPERQCDAVLSVLWS